MRGSVYCETEDGVLARGLSCNRWTCDECRPKRLAKLKRLAQSGRPTTMITLTCRHSSYESPDAAAQRLVQAWRLVLQRAKREGLAARIEYLCVFEEHKSGWPHLHILCRAPYLSHSWLSARMEEYADGPNVWIAQVKSARSASRYVAKYVSKGPGRFGGCKRYWRSQHYQIDEIDPYTPGAEDGPCWFYTPASLGELADAYRAQGWHVVAVENGGWLAVPPSLDAPLCQWQAWLTRGGPP